MLWPAKLPAAIKSCALLCWAQRAGPQKAKIISVQLQKTTNAAAVHYIMPKAKYLQTTLNKHIIL